MQRSSFRLLARFLRMAEQLRLEEKSSTWQTCFERRVTVHNPLGLRRWLQEEISISFDLQKGFESPQTGMYKPFFELDIGPLITVVEMSALKWDDKKGSTEA